MSVIIVLILASLTVGLIFLAAFAWSVRSGQYEDTLTPSLRVLADETTTFTPNSEMGKNPGPILVSKPNEPTGNDKKIKI